MDGTLTSSTTLNQISLKNNDNEKLPQFSRNEASQLNAV